MSTTGARRAPSAGPRPVPDWLDDTAIEIVRDAPQVPDVAAVSAATAYREAVEAMRWVRELLASGRAEPADIGIASATPGEYDDHLLTLRADPNLDLHFVHGVTVTACREGQAAALADILLRGLSQTRMRRLNTLLRAHAGPFADLPEGWTRILPAGAPLASPEAWTRLIDGLGTTDWPDGNGHGPALGDIVDLLSRGVDGASEAGVTLLQGHARDIWRRALAEGPAASFDLTLETLRQDDGIDPCARPAGCRRTRSRRLPVTSSGCSASTPRAGLAPWWRTAFSPITSCLRPSSTRCPSPPPTAATSQPFWRRRSARSCCPALGAARTADCSVAAPFFSRSRRTTSPRPERTVTKFRIRRSAGRTPGDE